MQIAVKCIRKSFSRIFKMVNTHKRKVQLYKGFSFLNTTELPFLHDLISSYTESHLPRLPKFPTARQSRTQGRFRIHEH
uniref:Uncharacterized protein n=1 Tax=Arundo donax TaxID=35708 RepID=A0A0A9EHC6_ARUDO